MIASELRASRLNVFVPPRCSQHQCVKDSVRDEAHPWRNCVVCKHYTKNLDSARCWECLGSKELSGFEVQSDVYEAAWYQEWKKSTR